MKVFVGSLSLFSRPFARAEALRFFSGLVFALVLIAGSITNGFGADATLRQDIRTFEYHSVRLRMNANDVAAALRRRGAIAITHAPCASDYVKTPSLARLKGDAGHCIQVISQRDAHTFLHVSFVEDWPERPGTSIAVLISSEITDVCSQCSRAMLSLVTQKLGPPTVADKTGSSWQVGVWCSEVCLDLTDASSTKNARFAKVVVQKPYSLLVSDFGLQEERESARLAYLSRHGVNVRDILSF